MRILFVTEISPFPLNGGEKLRSFGLIKILSELGHEVIGVIRNSSGVDLKKYSMSGVRFSVIQNNHSRFINLLGLSYFFKKREIVKIIQKELKDKNIDIVVLDFRFLGQYISIFKKKNIPVIYGTHNAQSNLTNQIPTSNIINWLIKKQNLYLQIIHEKIYFNKANILITVTKKDALFYQNKVNKDKIYVVPNFLDEFIYDKKYKKEDYFIMPANFKAFMNYEGLKWLINEVWDDELDAKSKLLIVGVNSMESFERIKKGKKFKNIIAVGEVDDMLTYIGKAKAVIIPLLHGSGARLKCLEAMALGISIISTSKGVEGINSKFFIVADTAIEFRNALLSFSGNVHDGENIKKEFETYYSLNANKELMKNIIYLAYNSVTRINQN